MGRNDSAMVVLAIFVSRFEAISCASLLRAYGFHVSLDGEHHASVEFNSMALGGHRLRVAKADLEAASQIMRDTNWLDDRVLAAPNSALLMMVGCVLLSSLAFFGWLTIKGSVTPFSLLLAPVMVYQLPVDPKGRPDFFLAESGS